MSMATGRFTMPTATGLLEPQKQTRHSKNGDLEQSHSTSSLPSTRAHSEPTSHFPFTPSLESTATSRMSNDDTYYALHNQGFNPMAIHSRYNNPAPLNTINPKDLLNPRKFDHSQRALDDRMSAAILQPSTSSIPTNPHYVFTPNTRESENSTSPEPEGSGMGNLIERFHNVEQRSDRPRKKLKKEHLENEDETGRPKSVFTGGGKGGEIGDYMREKRKEGQEESGRTATIVDLTADDDEEVQIINDDRDVEVCYGRLDNTKVQAHAVPYPSARVTQLTSTDWPPIKLQLRRFPGNNFIIRVLDGVGKDFGNVDVRTSLGLAPLMDTTNPKIRTTVRLNSRRRNPYELPGQPISDSLIMTVNLYGPKRAVGSIGRFLSQKQIYLRNPFMVERGIELCNPHAVKNPALPRTSSGGTSSGPGSGFISRTAEEVRSDVLGMFDSLEKSENLPEMEASSLLKTQLLPHQKQALYFLTKKEKARAYSNDENDGSLWRMNIRPNGQRMYVNVITGQEEHCKPPEVLGGILADMMGLGKTLSILALIVGSLTEAQAWARRSPEANPLAEVCPAINSKTTLLVAPLSTLANWEEQIKGHIKEGTLSCYVYHGNNRCNSIDELATYDMVITTYSIVSSEYNRRSKKRNTSPLLETNFFRVVLDEAHMIREQATQQSQAICTLFAQRRWAVTGTPVQNRLDDLGALIKFLRIKPFDEKGGFTQYILSPFKMADPDVLPKLRLLVDSVTLRRLKDRVNLPSRYDRDVRLKFSEEEQYLYDFFAKDASRKMEAIAGGQRKSLGGKAYVHVLQSILRLRLLCAHGKELLGEEDLKLTEGMSSMNAIDLDSDTIQAPTMTSRQAYDMLSLFRETNTDVCAHCARKVEPKDTGNEDGKDETLGYMLPCYQIVCKDCSKELKEIIDAKSQEDRFKCPFCDLTINVNLVQLTQAGVEAAEEAKQMARRNPKNAKIIGRYGGPHTKTTALVSALLQSKVESRAKPDEAPIKSVVFSGWTAHMDLIQIALDDNKIRYVRLDGKMSRSQRNASIDAFRDDPEIPVILVSITAGGLGLNLTAASKVYVMEPQFNPAAEAQAVDRVHRLGQTREVTNIRFIMSDSFEEKMLLLQRKKMNLADLSLNRGKLDRKEAARQKLEEIRSLFK